MCIFYFLPFKYFFFIKDKDLSKENQNSEINKAAVEEETTIAAEMEQQQNGNCQPNEETISVKTEDV